MGRKEVSDRTPIVAPTAADATISSAANQGAVRRVPMGEEVNLGAAGYPHQSAHKENQPDLFRTTGWV